MCLFQNDSMTLDTKNLQMGNVTKFTRDSLNSVLFGKSIGVNYSTVSSLWLVKKKQPFRKQFFFNQSHLLLILIG